MKNVLIVILFLILFSGIYIPVGISQDYIPPSMRCNKDKAIDCAQLLKNKSSEANEFQAFIWLADELKKCDLALSDLIKDKSEREILWGIIKKKNLMVRAYKNIEERKKHEQRIFK